MTITPTEECKGAAAAALVDQDEEYSIYYNIPINATVLHMGIQFALNTSIAGNQRAMINN